jgi:hypothetical protein
VSPSGTVRVAAVQDCPVLLCWIEQQCSTWSTS